MQGKDKNRNDYLSDFLRYHGDEMKDRERNAFEKKLQKDLFAEEASEGFAEAHPIVAETDISELRKRLIRRTTVKRRTLWYRVAATLAAVMILTSIFTIDWQKKPAEQFTQTPASSDLKESPALPQQSPEKARINDQMEVISDNQPQPVAKSFEKLTPVTAETKNEETHPVHQDEVVISEAREPEPAFFAEKSVSREKAGQVGVTGPTVPIRGKIISSEDNQPLPGAIITLKGTTRGAIADTGGNFRLDVNEAGDKVFVAQFVGMEAKEFKATRDSDLEIKLDPSVSTLNETVVVGYGVKKSETEKAEISQGYTPPQPIQGQAAFDRYIRENIRRPDSATTGQRVVVILSFMVEKTGKPDSITVVKSPGKPFSDEAIRLLREGPAWKPALENGEIIQDKIKIRIVFK